MASIGLSERLRLISSSTLSKAIGSDQISGAAGCQGAPVRGVTAQAMALASPDSIGLTVALVLGAGAGVRAHRRRRSRVAA
jgi:hypothetical protein